MLVRPSFQMLVLCLPCAIGCAIAGGAGGCIGGVPPPPPKPVPALLGPSAPLRRLTQEELNHTVRDLFTGIDVPFVELNDGEAVTRGASFDGDVARQTPSDLAIEQLRSGMNGVARAAVQRRDVLIPDGDVHTFIASFLSRALRRPAEKREVDAFTSFYDQQLADNDDDVALELTLQAVLQSPRFVYRVELGTGPAGTVKGAAKDAVALTPYETASRLSYFLWTTMPDQALFDAAAQNALATPAQIEAQARRMIEDPRAHDAVLSFHRQWLDLDRVLSQNKDAGAFPQWNEQLRRAMRTEADRMIEDVVFGDPDTGAPADPKLRTLLTTTKTRVDASLAAVYGVPAPAHDWDPVELPPDQRSGLLTNAAFLASRAHQVFGSPVLRGVFVLDRFLCESPPPPPPDVNTNPPDPAGQPAPTTNRERFAQHTFDTSCQGCHSTIDGIGFGLEGYDAIGQFRTTDNNLAVDDSGTVDGTAFHGGPGLASVLADSPVVHHCVAEHWLRFARGRGIEAADVKGDDAIVSSFEASDGDIKELLVAIVKQPSFRTIPSLGSSTAGAAVAGGSP